jgi:hypothetical protein
MRSPWLDLFTDSGRSRAQSEADPCAILFRPWQTASDIGFDEARKAAPVLPRTLGADHDGVGVTDHRDRLAAATLTARALGVA